MQVSELYVTIICREELSPDGTQPSDGWVLESIDLIIHELCTGSDIIKSHINEVLFSCVEDCFTAFCVFVIIYHECFHQMIRIRYFYLSEFTV